MNDLLLLVLALACLLLGMVQMAALGARARGVVALALGLVLWWCGPAASHTSLAQLGHWLAQPQRRLDLAALLLIEVLLFGQQAIALVQGRAPRYWRALAMIPPPSLLIVLFLALVWAMLGIDGVDFSNLALMCAVVFPLLFLAVAVLLRRLLPDPLMRTGVRLWLHAAQLGAGLWLARPLHQGGQFQTPAMWGRLGVLAVIVAALMALGWLCQRGGFTFMRKIVHWNS